MTVRLTVAVVAALSVLVAPSAVAAGSYDANELWAHEESVPLGERVTMWECWETGVGSNPRLFQRVGKKWKRLDVSSVKRDERRCGEDTPLKATYKFKVRNSLTWNKKARSYEATVRTRCKNCEPYNWTILVDK